MAKYRRGRINEEVMRETAMILREVKDPRVSEAFISVTGAEVTPDLKYAKIWYSAMRGDPKATAIGLKAATGFIRRQIAERLNLRVTPELTFVSDASIAYGAHISDLLSRIKADSEADGTASETPAGTEGNNNLADKTVSSDTSAAEGKNDPTDKEDRNA